MPALIERRYSQTLSIQFAVLNNSRQPIDFDEIPAAQWGMLRQHWAALLLLAVMVAAPPLAASQNSAPPRAPVRRSAKVPPDWPFEPPSPAQSVKIGNFYFHRHDYAGALSRYLEAVKSDPDYAPAYLALGKTYEATGKRRLALSAYEKYLVELPSDQDAERAKDVHKAIARLKRESASSRHD